MKPVYLRCLDVENNHYKYYKMTPMENDTFLAEWGREGANPQSKVYPMSKWESTYKSKIKKGYEDKSRHFVLEAKAPVETARVGKDGTLYAEIPDANVRQLVAQLMSMSKEVVKANYNISAEHVTQAMIDEAQSLIDKLVKLYKDNNTEKQRNYTGTNLFLIRNANTILVNLMNTVPRKVNKLQNVLFDEGMVRDSYEKFSAELLKTIRFEEDLLNNMRTCVAANVIDTQAGKQESKSQTILEALGLEIVPCTAKEMEQIMSVFTPDDIRYGLPKMVIGAYKITNKRTEKAFEEFKKTYKDGYKRFPCKLLWHGSRNENWWSIIYQGLKIRPSNAVYTGSMFGDGIYFANKARKSYGYTSSTRACWTNGTSNIAFMALYNVAVGNQRETYTNSGFYNMSFSKLRQGERDSEGRCYHSVYAKAGRQLRNDELIMYDDRQTTIRYLVMFDEGKR